jgi:hypothetical protein
VHRNGVRLARELEFVGDQLHLELCGKGAVELGGAADPPIPRAWAIRISRRRI